MKQLFSINWILFSLIFLCCGRSNLITPSTDISKLKSHDLNEFPSNWMGYWKGDLNVYKENKLVRTVPMALDLGYTDTVGYYNWAIIYGPDSIAGRRDYYLNTVDAEKGHYQTDEKNSIILDSYLYDNRLITNFEVGNSRLQSTYTLSGDVLSFEIIVTSEDPVATTGNQVVGSDTIPEVKSYPVTTIQRAILKKS